MGFLTKLCRMPKQISIENSRSDQNLPELPFELTFDSVDSWLTRVPLKDSQESSRLVFSALRRLNRYCIDPIRRIGILERFTPCVFGLSAELEPLFVDATFPLDPGIRRISRLGSQLHAQLAAGYLLVIDRRNSDDNKISEQEKVLALVRTLQSTYWYLIRTVQIYEAPSTRFWKRLYTVLRYAEHCDLLYLKVPDRDRQTAYSIESLFKQITLLWLANPYRHPQHHIKQIVSLLDEFAELVELRNHRPDSVAESTFFVDLTFDAPPRHISHLTDRETDTCRFLYASPMIEGIMRFVKDPFSELRQIDPAPDRELVVRLVKTLAGTEKRKHRRKSENASVQFIMGFGNIIEALSQPEQKQDYGNPGSSQPLLDTPGYDLLPVDHERSTPFPQLRSRQQSPGNRVTAEQIWGNRADADLLSEPSYSIGRVRNSSVEGYQLMTPDDSSTNVKVGEMIAIEQDNQPLHLGAVRWLESSEGRGIQFGIELLSRAVHFARATFGVNALRKEHILFVDKTAGVNTPCSIVLSHAKYRSGTLVEMLIAGRPRYFRLQKLIELSPGFVRYTLSEPHVQ